MRVTSSLMFNFSKETPQRSGIRMLLKYRKPLPPRQCSVSALGKDEDKLGAVVVATLRMKYTSASQDKVVEGLGFRASVGGITSQP